MQRIIVRLR